MRHIFGTGKVDESGETQMPRNFARVVLGGKGFGALGIMPGIFEEILYSLRPAKDGEFVPIFLLGGFGGAAKNFADALLGKKRLNPDPLTIDGQRGEKQFGKQFETMLRGYEEFGDPEEPARAFKGLSKLIEEARGNLAKTFKNGLDEGDNEKLLTTRTIPEAVGLVLKGLRKLASLS